MISIILASSLLIIVPVLATTDWKSAKTIYEFTVKDINGTEVSLDTYKGKPILVVNVASKCGLTEANYKGLNGLYEKYEAQGLIILAFPSNQFAQEPGSAEEIKKFRDEHKVKFNIMDKIEINGENANELYKWLKAQKKGDLGLEDIKWNFEKFLIDKNGVPVNRFGSTADYKDIENEIKKQF